MFAQESSEKSRREATSRQQLTFLAEAGAILASSLDYETTLTNVAHLAVPKLGDWCAVDILEDSGAIRSLAVAHSDPAKVALARTIRQRYPPDPKAQTGVPNVLRTGKAERLVKIPDFLLEASVPDPEQLRLLRELGLKSYLCVPLVARGRTLGAITLISAESGRRYTAADQRFAEDLARHAALAVDNARLYLEAQTQRQRLDAILASVPGVVWEAWGQPDSAAQRIDFVSDYVEKMLGYSVEEWLTTPNFWLTIVHPEDRARAAQTTAAQFASGTGGINRFRWMTQDGRTLWVESQSTIICDETGAPIGMRGVTLDFTEHRKQEESLLQNQFYIAALNQKLQRAMIETHHRVRNSLQFIAAMVDMLAMSSGEAIGTRELKQLGRHIHTLAVVHSLLTEQAKRDGEARYVSAYEILERLMPILQDMAGSRPLHFEIEEARLTADQGTSLPIVVNELVSNALKYGKNEVGIVLSAEDGKAILEVCDDGPGFPQDFNPKTAARTGLELVQNLSQWDLRGCVAFENRSEGGACVRVTISLPVEAAY